MTVLDFALFFLLLFLLFHSFLILRGEDLWPTEVAFLHHKIHRSKTCTCRASAGLLQRPSRHCHWSAEAGGGEPGRDKAVRKINTRFKKQTARLMATGRKPLGATAPCFASALDTEDNGGHSTRGSSRRFRSRHSYLRVRLCGPRTRHLGHSGLSSR